MHGCINRLFCTKSPFYPLSFSTKASTQTCHDGGDKKKVPPQNLSAIGSATVKNTIQDI